MSSSPIEPPSDSARRGIARALSTGGPIITPGQAEAIRRAVTADDPPGVAWCDHCHEPVARGRAGWWIGDDGTADCRRHLTGHEVNGSPR